MTEEDLFFTRDRDSSSSVDTYPYTILTPHRIGFVLRLLRLFPKEAGRGVSITNSSTVFSHPYPFPLWSSSTAFRFSLLYNRASVEPYLLLTFVTFLLDSNILYRATSCRVQRVVISYSYSHVILRSNSQYRLSVREPQLRSFAASLPYSSNRGKKPPLCSPIRKISKKVRC